MGQQAEGLCEPLPTKEYTCIDDGQQEQEIKSTVETIQSWFVGLEKSL